MSKAANGIKQPNELSGFGFPETATAVEVCARDNCYRDYKPAITDLYCRKHGRFLPLITAPISVRVLAAIFASLIIYGSFELAAQIDSQLPIFIVYATICLGLVALPLRHFSRTAAIASLIWIIASIIPIIAHDASGHLHVVLAAAVLVGSVAILAIYAIADAPYTELPRSLTRESRVISRIVAVALIIAVWSAVASAALHYESYILPGSESRVARVMLIIALISLAVGALIVSASSVVIGVRGINQRVPTLTKPSRPIWVTPGPSPRNNHPQNALDLAVGTAISAANMLVAIGRIVVNCIAQVAYVLAYIIVTLANLVIRFAVLTARWAQATIASVARLSFYAAFIACRCIFDPIASILVPVSALIGTPWLVMASANETRLYLLHGPAAALRSLFIMMLATTALLLGTWVILANQHPRESFESFQRSAQTTVAYGFVILLFGGWLLGLAGALGYGHIHIGRITLSLTGVAIIFLLVLAIKGRADSKANKQPAPSPATAPSSSPDWGTGGRTWTIAVALVMIVGAVTGLAILAPWAKLPVAQPTELTTDTRTTTSVTISWSMPSSGPLPARYVIMQNGKAIGSVPGTAISYRATKLAPATQYTYQVIAVRGARRSPQSSAMAAYTSTPQLWTAILTGQWTVHYKNLAWNGPGSPPSLATDIWKFTPKCTGSQCSVALTGALENEQFTATLRQSRGVYTGNAKDNNDFACVLTTTNGDLTLKISVLGGQVVGGQWVVSSWGGTIILSTPGSFFCTPAKITATIYATTQ